MTRINQEQIAAGARTDATLRPYHFHEAELNSLGLEKLDHMVSGAPRDGALVVYLDVPSDGDEKALAAARRKAVTEYLSGRGMAERSFRLESGHNPRATVPVRSLQRETDAIEPAPEAPPTGFGSSGGGSGRRRSNQQQQYASSGGDAPSFAGGPHNDPGRRQGCRRPGFFLRSCGQ